MPAGLIGANRQIENAARDAQQVLENDVPDTLSSMRSFMKYMKSMFTRYGAAGEEQMKQLNEHVDQVATVVAKQGEHVGEVLDKVAQQTLQTNVEVKQTLETTNQVLTNIDGALKAASVALVCSAKGAILSMTGHSFMLGTVCAMVRRPPTLVDAAWMASSVGVGLLIGACSASVPRPLLVSAALGYGGICTYATIAQPIPQKSQKCTEE